ncbi:GNAT family N-acetyltransferase [Bacillus sp. JJ664]
MLHHFIEFKTERLQLRRFKDEDLEYFYQYRANPEIAKYQGWQNYSYEQAISFIEKQKIAIANVPDTWVQVAIEQKESGRLIGDFGIHTLKLPHNTIEIGFTLDPQFQKQGYASEALKGLINHLFNDLHKESIQAIAVEQNESSIKLLKRMGFTQVKKIENSLFKGQIVNEFVFELTKNDWVG